LTSTAAFGLTRGLTSLVHAPDEVVDLALAVACLAALHVVQALLVNAAACTAKEKQAKAIQDMLSSAVLVV
jgi:hypothetical protein